MRHNLNFCQMKDKNMKVSTITYNAAISALSKGARQNIKDELDFNNRLIAKFRLKRDRFFKSKGFGAIPKSALYPFGDKGIGTSRRNEIKKNLARCLHLFRYHIYVRIRRALQRSP